MKKAIALSPSDLFNSLRTYDFVTQPIEEFNLSDKLSIHAGKGPTPLSSVCLLETSSKSSAISFFGKPRLLGTEIPGQKSLRCLLPGQQQVR